MDPKLLTENRWKVVAVKFKVKDNGLQKALAAYEKLEEDEHEERLKAIAAIKRLAGELKKGKELAQLDDVTDHLGDVVNAAELHRKQVEVEAAKANADAKKQADLDKKKKEDEEEESEDEDAQDEEEEEEAAYHVKLFSALQKLKSGKGVSGEFIVCDAKPHNGLMVAKRINSKHKEELTRITGSKRFLHIGRCRFEDGKFIFEMEQPVTGLARKLQDSIKHFTGKKLPIAVGTESAEIDEEPVVGAQSPPQPGAAQKPSQPAPAHAAATQAQAAAGPAAKAHAMAHLKLIRPQLIKAPDVWHQTRKAVETHVDQLKTAIRNEYAVEGPELLAEIDKNMMKLDWILDTLDHKLADSIAKANAAQNPAERQAELKNSKLILANYIKYVKSEPMIAHIDSNPFGVQTNLKQMLADSLTHMAQAIG
jgi:hypothetical protein